MLLRSPKYYDTVGFGACFRLVLSDDKIFRLIFFSAYVLACYTNPSGTNEEYCLSFRFCNHDS